MSGHGRDRRGSSEAASSGQLFTGQLPFRRSRIRTASFSALLVGRGLHTQVLVPAMDGAEEDLKENHDAGWPSVQPSGPSAKGLDGARPGGRGTERELMVPKGHRLKDSSVPIT